MISLNVQNTVRFTTNQQNFWLVSRFDFFLPKATYIFRMFLQIYVPRGFRGILYVCSNILYCKTSLFTREPSFLKNKVTYNCAKLTLGVHSNPFFDSTCRGNFAHLPF